MSGPERAPRPAAPAPLPVDLYYRNLSFIHADGDRLLYSRAGLCVVETLVGDRGGVMLVRRRVFRVSEDKRQEVNAFLDTFPRGFKPAERLGVMDEVRDRFFVGPDAFDVWQNDIPKQPEAFQRLMAQVSGLLAASANAPSTTIELSGPLAWPPEFLPDKRPD